VGRCEGGLVGWFLMLTGLFMVLVCCLCGFVLVACVLFGGGVVGVALCG